MARVNPPQNVFRGPAVLWQSTAFQVLRDFHVLLSLQEWNH